MRTLRSRIILQSSVSRIEKYGEHTTDTTNPARQIVKILVLSVVENIHSIDMNENDFDRWID